MKVSVIMGSPRKKNTYDICSAIELRVNQIEPVEFSYCMLSEEKLEFCRGCMQCIVEGDEHCGIQDGIKSVWESMLGADAVILASPAYAHNVTGLMKNFVDRSSYFFHRPPFIGRPAIVVSTTATTGIDEVLDYLTLVAKGWGYRLVGSLGVVMRAFEMSQQYQANVNREISRLSMRLVRAMKGREEIAPTVDELVFFGVMKEKAKHIEVDREYWEKKGWMDRPYYVDRNISRFKRWIAAFKLGRHKRKMRKFFE